MTFLDCGRYGGACVETSGGAVQDLGLASHLRVVSPRTPIGRVVFDGPASEAVTQYRRLLA